MYSVKVSYESAAQFYRFNRKIVSPPTYEIGSLIIEFMIPAHPDNRNPESF